MTTVKPMDEGDRQFLIASYLANSLELPEDYIIRLLIAECQCTDAEARRLIAEVGIGDSHGG